MNVGKKKNGPIEAFEEYLMGWNIIKLDVYGAPISYGLTKLKLQLLDTSTAIRLGGGPHLFGLQPCTPTNTHTHKKCIVGSGVLSDIIEG